MKTYFTYRRPATMLTSGLGGAFVFNCQVTLVWLGIPFVGSAHIWNRYVVPVNLTLGTLLLALVIALGIWLQEHLRRPRFLLAFCLGHASIPLAACLVSIVTDIAPVGPALFLTALTQVTLPVFIGTWLVCRAVWGIPIRPGRWPECQACGYALRGNVSGRCPECGTAWDPAHQE